MLLQLVFPAYLFFLTFLTIILSRYSNFFATLLSNRNPVAALCTFIFLSYFKLLQFIIAALQSTTLEIPGSSNERVWLCDANVQFFTLSQIPHFVAAVLILTAGVFLTLELFFAQWLPRFSKWRLMRWTRNTKYTGLTDAYHAPFTRKHRYWVGLLLFTLIIHSVVAVTAVDDFLPVLSMGSIAIGLILLKLLNKQMYKSKAADYVETAFLFNLAFLAYGTLYARAPETKYVTVHLANISMGLSACLFLVIICYHSYKYVYLQSRFFRRHKTCIKKILTRVKAKCRSTIFRRKQTEELVSEQEVTLKTHYTAMRSHNRREPDLDILAPITASDYEIASPPQTVHTKVTCTIIERETNTTL